MSNDVVEYIKLIYGPSDGDIEVLRPFDQRLSRNFKLSEFHCKCDQGTCTNTLVSRNLVAVLQCIRDAFNASIIISSGYRCAYRNAEVGGSKDSQHMRGTAADLVAKDMKALMAMVPIIRALPLVGGIGHYFRHGKPAWLHVDVRPRGALGITEWREDK